MNDSDDDFAAALRRELAGTAVPYDDGGADAMIRTATANDLLGARTWQAPLAAAAAVVVVGGGTAAVVATRGDDGTPANSPDYCIGAGPSGSAEPTPVPIATGPIVSTTPSLSTAGVGTPSSAAGRRSTSEAPCSATSLSPSDPAEPAVGVVTEPLRHAPPRRRHRSPSRSARSRVPGSWSPDRRSRPDKP